jgi:D-alanyl-D-alanine dipeptidase
MDMVDKDMENNNILVVEPKIGMDKTKKTQKMIDQLQKSYMITKANNQDLVVEEDLYPHQKKEVKLMVIKELMVEQDLILENLLLIIW